MNKSSVKKKAFVPLKNKVLNVMLTVVMCYLVVSAGFSCYYFSGKRLKIIETEKVEKQVCKIFSDAQIASDFKDEINFLFSKVDNVHVDEKICNHEIIPENFPVISSVNPFNSKIFIDVDNFTTTYINMYFSGRFSNHSLFIFETNSVPTNTQLRHISDNVYHGDF